MSLHLLIDMNLSPAWVPALKGYGWAATHWSIVGDPRAPDREVMEWARTHGCVVFTHDLDFTTMLALTRATGPSVLQVRTRNVLPEGLAALVDRTLRLHETELAQGALVVIDEQRARLRILPL